MTGPEHHEQPDEFTCPDCGHTAPRLLGGLISLHEPDCPNVCEDDDLDYDDSAEDES